jgi:hypothetical protein
MLLDLATVGLVTLRLPTPAPPTGNTMLMLVENSAATVRPLSSINDLHAVHCLACPCADAVSLIGMTAGMVWIVKESVGIRD